MKDIKKILIVAILSALSGVFAVAAAYGLGIAQKAAPSIIEDTASNVIIDDFSGALGTDGLPQGWRSYRLPRKKALTGYSVQRDGDNWFLKASSSEAASAIYKELHIDIVHTPILRWRWKIDHTLKKGDETRRDGDDYAGRIYVTFEYQPEKTTFYDKIKRAVAEKVFGVTLPGKTVNYIWANKLVKDSAVFNPYTDNIIMVAVESGDRMSGQWISEERDVLADYRRFFHDEPPKATGIVIMDYDGYG
ncbi:MAG: DUF3047 domain-containing protein [Deltaproteobacteria bacterium]|nr:DUF3047 domain-containing protein [Deltaproteobacteria bacterium]